MRVAVISDLHGNYRALEAVLADIEREAPDLVVCAGDIVNPFLRSRDVWQELKRRGIPCVRGNHEDYITAYFKPDLRPAIRESVQFRPVQLVARHLGADIAAELAAIPFTLVVPGPGGDDLFFCHASPNHNSRSFWLGVDAEMAHGLRAVRPRTIVAGHIHSQWVGEWENKHLVIAGSVGLPLNGSPRPGYVLMEHAGGDWCAVHRTVGYDQENALKEYRESGALREGGPVAWMLHEELRTAEPHLSRFFPKLLESKKGTLPAALEDWEREGRRFLEELGTWESVEPYL